MIPLLNVTLVISPDTPIGNNKRSRALSNPIPNPTTFVKILSVIPLMDVNFVSTSPLRPSPLSSSLTYSTSSSSTSVLSILTSKIIVPPIAPPGPSLPTNNNLTTHLIPYKILSSQKNHIIHSRFHT